MQAKVTLSRSAQFAAGRVLRRHDWSDARNLEVYGKQSRPHGHDYTLIVYYRGVPSHVDGMVVNISVLKTVINDVLAPLDGALLNELPAFKLRPPTAENLVDFLWTQLPATIAGGVLTRLCLQETRDLHV